MIENLQAFTGQNREVIRNLQALTGQNRDVIDKYASIVM